MELRVHFPPWATKRVRFAEGATVGDALRSLAARHAHALPPPGKEAREGGRLRRSTGSEKNKSSNDRRVGAAVDPILANEFEGDEDEGGEDEEQEEHYYQGGYGLFIPRWANERVSGWLGGETVTLSGLGLRSGDVVECRPRRHRLTLLLPNASPSHTSSLSLSSSSSSISASVQPRLLRVTTPAALTVARLLPRLLRAVTADGKGVPVIEPSLSAVVGLLDRDAELLHLPLPHEKVMYLLASAADADLPKNRKKTNGSTTAVGNQADLCNLYIWLPSKEGLLWRYGERSSRFGKRWQKRYFVLQKDKLFYYKSQNHKVRGEALSFIGVQRVRAIVNTEPFDSFSRKCPDCCFQIESSTGEVHHLIAENQQQQTEWTEQLMAWLELKLFFGPDKRSSVQLFRKLSAEREGRHGRPAPPPHTPAPLLLPPPPPHHHHHHHPQSPPLSPTRASSKAASLKNEGRTSQKKTLDEEKKKADQEEAEEDKGGKNEDDDEEEEEEMMLGEGGAGTAEINLLLQDGSIQPLVIDPNIEIYDLVYAVAHEIGSGNAFQITSLDQDPSRRVELLDHQKTLRQHLLPNSAMFVLKKTGIVDEHIGENDIFDNHFLYAMLPEAEGYLLKSVMPPATATEGGMRKGPPSGSVCAAGRRWRKRFFALKANRLMFYPSHHDLSPLGFIPLGSIAAVGRPSSASSSFSSAAFASDLEEEEKEVLRECLVRVRTVDGTVVLLLAETRADADQWIGQLRSWRQFFALDAFADDRPAGLTPDPSHRQAGDHDGNDGKTGVDGVDCTIAPLSFVRAGAQLLAARAAAREKKGKEKAEEEAPPAEEEAQREEEEEKEETERETGQASPKPKRPSGLTLLATGSAAWRPATPPAEDSAGSAASPRSPRDSEGLLASSMSETRGRESPRGASGWLSPRRLVEALSFRSLASSGGGGSSLAKKSESARTERD